MGRSIRPPCRRLDFLLLSVGVVAATVGRDTCSGRDCHEAEEESAALLQVPVPPSLEPGAGGDLSLVMAGAELEAGAGDPRTPPCCGSDLEIGLLMADRDLSCETVLLTNVFGTRKDPQGKLHAPPDFSYFERYYRSVLSVPGGRVKAVVLHDFLTEDVTSNYTTKDGSMSFVKVDISGLDPLMGLNDLRFQLFDEQIKKHPEWETVFITDISDVVVVHNPCGFVEKQPERIFSGSQRVALKPYPYMNGKFEELGGKYLEWYDSLVDYKRTLMNAGILGGKRSVVLKALSALNAVLLDPELSSRKQKTDVTVNMAAFNYALHSNFEGHMVTGFPLHSKFWNYENRTDVYFRHK